MTQHTHELPPQGRVRRGAPAIAAALALSGCEHPGGVVEYVDPATYLGAEGTLARQPVTHPQAHRVQTARLAVEYLPTIDRFTYFGPRSGPNLLHTTALDQPPADTDEYTFYGGCYTWTSPQNGANGWIAPTGELLGWPPDPAMNVGPGRVSGRSINGITFTTPVQRSGLQEIKHLEFPDDQTARLTVEYRNTGASPIDVGAWIITACAPDAVIAIRTDRNAPRWGWGDDHLARLDAISETYSNSDWMKIRLEKANWQGGVKVYYDATTEIAIWHKGYWHYRKLSPAPNPRLRTEGEGPVAIYIQPDAGIFEAELYGPIETVMPGDAAAATETWQLFKVRQPLVTALPSLEDAAND